MRAKTIIAVLFLPVLTLAHDSAKVPFPCALVHAPLNLRIDGSLSDWDSSMKGESLRLSKHAAGEPTSDNATAVARCVADSDFIYFGVTVSASSLRFDTVPFNQAWRNDSVEVYFTSDSESSGPHVRTGVLRASLDSSGQTLTEGSLSVAEGERTTRQFSYPLLWEAVGARAASRRVPGGYNVEVALPRYSLGWSDAAIAPAIAVNVRVRRSCGKNCRAVLESSNDPYDSSPFGEERYRRLSFSQPFSMIDGEVRQTYTRVLAPLVCRALLRLDALDAEGAVAILRDSQDSRISPMTAGALIAAGDGGSAESVLRSLQAREFGEGLRSWAVEQLAQLKLSTRSFPDAEREFAALADSTFPQVRDIGFAGIIEAKLAMGEGEQARTIYDNAFGGRSTPGIRSGSVLFEWLQKQGRAREALEVITRLSESEWASDSERAWALFQLQCLYEKIGNVEKALSTGWELQERAPVGDPSGEAGLKRMIALMTFGRSASAAASFSAVYSEFIAAHRNATDPQRQLAYAAALQWERKVEQAAGIYAEVGADTGALRKDRATALLRLQRMQFDSGQFEWSIQTGLIIHNAFPRNLAPRFASWDLIRAATEASPGLPNSLQKQVEVAVRSLAREIQQAPAGAHGRAAAALRQLNVEVNQQ